MAEVKLGCSLIHFNIPTRPFHYYLLQKSTVREIFNINHLNVILVRVENAKVFLEKEKKELLIDKGHKFLENRD